MLLLLDLVFCFVCLFVFVSLLLVCLFFLLLGVWFFWTG